MTTDLENPRKQIATGNLQKARESLTALTARDPLNKEAWELLASITEDPHQRADCYRHMLQIDPADRQAASRYLEITAQIQKASAAEEPAQEFDPILYCKQCGGPAEVYFVGDLHDKRAVCSYCGTEVDLPDSYSRIQKLREHHTLPGGGEHTIEKTVFETRQDGIPDSSTFENYPPELQHLIQTLREKESGAFIPDPVEGNEQYRVDIESDRGSLEAEVIQTSLEQEAETPEESPGPETAQNQTETRKEKTRSIFTFPFFKQKKTDRKRRPLSIDEVILRSGGPLPPEERRTCPNPSCDAVISKSAKQCPWCGEKL